MPMNGLREILQAVVVEQQNQSPFDYLELQMEDILGNGGILKELVHSGVGPPVPQNASVLMHYSGFLEYSDQPFETTTHLKHPPLMKLGRDVTLMGMELGLLTMRKGEFSRFLLQPHYAYGHMGCPPLIPAASRVLFEIHIVDFMDSGQVDEFVQLTLGEQNEFPVSRVMEVVDTLRSFGNRCFNQSRYEKAKERYKQALELLGNRENASDGEQTAIQAALLPLYLNLALAELRLDSPKKTLKYAKKALDINGDSAKALYRCAQAYVELRDYESAHACLVKAQARKPFDSNINNLLKTVTVGYKEHLDKESDLYKKMFPGWNKTPDDDARQ
ncbi:inactive peptidyl-prolyl cis-trans isomerase FKBP6 isoform X1 [Festucalex cinctus]